MLKNIIPLIIVGSGPAAFTASIYAGRAKLDHIIITGDVKGGQLITSLDIENFPGFPIIGGLELMMKLEEHAKTFGAKLISDTIVSVDFNSSTLTLKGKKTEYFAKTVIIATGSSPKVLGLTQETTLLGKGISYCATCDGNFYKNHTVAVVGGGNVAVEEAIYLANLAKKVYLIHRRDSLRAEQILQDKLFNTPNIELLWDSEVKELHESNGFLNQISLYNNKSNTTKPLDITGLFIAIGHTPNTGFLGNSLKLDDSGYIITANKSTHTSAKGVFAAGDVQDSIYRQAITSSATGCMAALDANLYLIKNN
ncbi:thioredoxin-disulfide reductase [Rickettsiales bacterium LUAb2]